MITPIRCGVDTLEATFAGTLDEEFVTDLQVRKERAQARGEADEVMICGEMLHLLPKGAGLWPYVLRSDALIIRLGTAKNVPAMSVRLLAHGLAECGVDILWAKAREIADALGLVFQNCSRLDVALDYQGDWFTFEEMLNVVCPANFRPVYPNTTKPQTFQFGKGDIVVRIYDKSAEIAANDHPWWVYVWRVSEDYSQELPVYRVEAQVRGPILRELGLRTVDKCVESLPELFDYALRWCSLRSPSEDSNKSRWPEDPRWTALRTASAPTRSLSRVRPARALMGYDAAVKRFVGTIASAGAAVGSTDYWALAKAITTDAEQRIEGPMDTTFEQLVEKKRKQQFL